MKRKSYISPPSIETISAIIIDGVIPSPLTPSGDSTQNSSEPTSSTSTPQPTDLNSFVARSQRVSPPTPHSSPPNMSADLSNPNSTASPTKFLLMILISLSLWGILLSGLYAGVLVFLSYGVPPNYPLIALAATSCFLLTTLLLCYVSGRSDPPQ